MDKQFYLKTPSDFAKMAKAGKVLSEAHAIARERVRPGVSTVEINQAVENFLSARNVEPLFKGVPGPVPFPAACCLSVNEELVHGIPGPRVLKDGDILSVDIGVRCHGWCSDAARTYPVGSISKEKQNLLSVTEGVLALAIKRLSERQRWSQIAAEMEAFCWRNGMQVIRDLIGHGIGREMWELPEIPNFSSAEFEARDDFDIVPGLALAIEPMVCLGSPSIVTLSDGWTVITRDRKPNAHFEDTVIVTEDGVRALTRCE